MSVPLTATWRIEFQLTISGHLRKVRVYVNSVGAVVAGVTQIIDRGGLSAPWTNFMNQFLAVYATAIAPTELASPVTAILQQRTGAVWNPIEVQTPAITPTAAHFQPASQATYVLRDTAFDKVRVQYPESAVPIPFHSNGNAPSGGMRQIGSQFDGTNTTIGTPGDDAHFWQVSRGGRYLAASGTVVGVTTDFNNKYRRARGLA